MELVNWAATPAFARPSGSPMVIKETYLKVKRGFLQKKQTDIFGQTNTQTDRRVKQLETNRQMDR